MAAKADFQRLLDKIGAEDVGGQVDNIPVVPETGATKKNDSSTGAGDFEFRPLTEEREARIRRFFGCQRQADIGRV